MPKSRPPYPAAFRQQMVELVRSGRTPGEADRGDGHLGPGFTVVKASTTALWYRRRHAPRRRCGPPSRGVAAPYLRMPWPTLGDPRGQ